MLVGQRSERPRWCFKGLTVREDRPRNTVVLGHRKDAHVHKIIGGVEHGNSSRLCLEKLSKMK